MRTILPPVSGKTYIGIDNGVSGSVGIIPASGINPHFFHMPVFSELNYTKEVRHITRIDYQELKENLSQFCNPFAVLERPMVNPQRFQASASALRALEATIITLERLAIPYLYIDSKQWQQMLLPKGIKGSEELKKASLDIGRRLFPQFKNVYKADADGILIAEWARRTRL